jgi:ribonuclease D
VLTDAQITYALEDVRYLPPLYEKLADLLERTKRRSWFDEEMATWREDVAAAQDRKDWRRVSGIGSLNWRSLAIVRELWHWRQQEAQRLNQPPKRLLRDDLPWRLPSGGLTIRTRFSPFAGCSGTISSARWASWSPACSAAKRRRWSQRAARRSATRRRSSICWGNS